MLLDQIIFNVLIGNKFSDLQSSMVLHSPAGIRLAPWMGLDLDGREDNIPGAESAGRHKAESAQAWQALAEVAQLSRAQTRQRLIKRARQLLQAMGRLDLSALGLSDSPQLSTWLRQRRLRAESLSR
jgi:hypothetical protein